jgi:hypothetical protein
MTQKYFFRDLVVKYRERKGRILQTINIERGRADYCRQ